MSKPTVKASTSRKSGSQPKPNPPEPDMDSLKEEAKTILKTAKQQMDSSGNLKTTIKETLISSLQRLFEIIDLLNDSRLAVKNNLEIMMAKRKSEQDQNPASQVLKVLEAIKEQDLITKTTQAALLLITEEIKGMKDLQAAQQRTLELMCKAPAKLVEAAEEQNIISGNTQQAIQSLKEEIIEMKEIQTQERPNNDDKMDEINGKLDIIQTHIDIIQTQNEVAKEIKQEVKEVKNELESIEQIQQEKQIQQIEQVEPDKDKQKTPNKTYSEALIEQRPKTTHCLIVGTEDAIDTSEDVITKIKDTINAKGSGLQIAKLRKVKDQRVLIGCEKRTDIEHIKEILEKNNFKVEPKENKDPLVILRNVTSSITDKGILQAIEKQNPEVLESVPMEQHRMKVRHRRRARDPTENHVVLQVSPQMWQAMTTAGRLYVEFQRVSVFHLSPLIQCSRCLAFGHGKKWCTESVDLCSHCTGPHMRTECPSLLAGEEPTCRNCQQAKCARTDHNSFDTHCPVRKKWDALARSSIAYN